LKTIEKLVNRHIRDEVLGLRPLLQHHFAYQPGKSTEIALHHMITHTQEAVQNREITLGALQDIQGAFNTTSLEIITKAAKSMGLKTQSVIGLASCYAAGKL
jgi:NADH:ubiquinone oxidoreductase subunit E